MPAPLLQRKTQLLFDTEAAEGTAITLTAADNLIAVYDAEFTPEFEVFKREPYKTSLSPLPGVVGQQAGRISFRAELVGSGTAGTLPPMDKLLKACSMVVATAAGTSNTYTPTSVQSENALTMYLQTDGVMHKVRGARGTVRFTATVGEPAFAEFEFLGVYDGTVTQAQYAATTVSTKIPNVFMGANTDLRIGGYAAICSSFTFDLGNELALRSDMNVAGGYISCKVSGRSPSGSLDPEFTTIANHDWFGRFAAGTTGNLNLQVGPDSDAGNVIKFTGTANCQTSDISRSDRDGVATIDLSFDLVTIATAGDNEISVAFI